MQGIGCAREARGIRFAAQIEILNQHRWALSSRRLYIMREDVPGVWIFPHFSCGAYLNIQHVEGLVRALACRIP